MANGTSIEYSKQFQFVGTIKKVATFASKGGGLMVELETGDKNIASEVVNSQGMACNFVIQVSAVRVGSGSVGEDQPELDGIHLVAPEGEEEV